MSRLIASLAIVGILVTGFGVPVGAVSKNGHLTGSLKLSPGTEVSVAVAKAGLPIAGRVVLRSWEGRATVIGVGKSGRFSLNLRPGTYTAFGGPPGWFPECRANDGTAFKVTVGHTLRIEVWCVAM